MKLSKLIEDYKYRENEFVGKVSKRGVEDLNVYCASSGMNIVVAYYFVYKHFPDHKEIATTKLASLCKFYRVDDDLTQDEEIDDQL